MNIKVDLHSHTLASAHAYTSVKEYVEEAVKKNLEMIAITDHGPALPDSAHEWHFYNLSAVPKVIEGVRILKGIESNILDDGSIDCSTAMAKKLDFVMAGFHSPVYMPCDDVDKNTDTLVKVICLEEVKVITHPGNSQFPVHHDVIADVASRNRVALEVNSASVKARPGSINNCRGIIEAVKRSGGYISLGSDAHFYTQIGELSNAVSLLKEVKFPMKKVINTSTSLTLDFLGV